jgi:hypothetical protein
MQDPVSVLLDALWQESHSPHASLVGDRQPNGLRLSLWLRGRRSGTRTCRTHRFPGRVVVAPTGARDAQAEGLEVFFGAQTHRVVANPCLRFSLPPFAVLAQTPI